MTASLICSQLPLVVFSAAFFILLRHLIMASSALEASTIDIFQQDDAAAGQLNEKGLKIFLSDFPQVHNVKRQSKYTSYYKGITSLSGTGWSMKKVTAPQRNTTSCIPVRCCWMQVFIHVIQNTIP